ncbi:MAG: hypothetical protein IPL26_19570 [Leptospiraceae bacterium]|nr:hypothetical protein [Leptospiraceae bacterium]
MDSFISKTRVWDQSTPADGNLFEAEFLAAYSNLQNLYNFALSQLGSQSGLIQGPLRNVSASPTIIKAARNNVYEVDGNVIRLNGDLSLNFSSLTNIFRNDGITPIAATSETQNKQMYIKMTTTGSLHAMIIPDSEMEGSSHVYANNPELCKDYYAASPVIWTPAKNGYYKNGKRLIGVCRLDGSNNIQYLYELGIGHRFLDVQHIPIGGKFTEWRWKREHPACYVPDGSVIATLATDAPDLHRILGSTTLPDWRDRFGRNIDLAGARSIRDTQEDAFQGHWHELATYISDNVRGGGSNSLFFFNNTENNKVRNAITDTVNGTPRTASETRPRNFAELVQIVRG